MDFALLEEETEAAATTLGLPRRQNTGPSSRSMRRRRRPFQEGDLAIVVERHDSYVPVYLRAGEKHMNRFGAFHHDDVIGKPFGAKVSRRRAWIVGLGRTHLSHGQTHRPLGL